MLRCRREINEGNRILAEFMGMNLQWYKLGNSEDIEVIDSEAYIPEWWRAEELKYDSDWNWLMPVWLKFRDLDIYDPLTFKLKWKISQEIIKTNSPLEVFKQLVKAVKWYNSIKK